MNFDKNTRHGQKENDSSWFVLIIQNFYWAFVFIFFQGCSASEMDTVVIDNNVATIVISPNDEPIISLDQEVQLGLLAKNSA
ncbi:MAG: hypothetical protein P8M34_11145 [Saprospiraceae bacterium]|nr:hypothetical protein [Saprospiraceae bacterium]